MEATTVPRQARVIKSADREHQASQQEAHKKGFWDQFVGQKLVFQMKGGQIVAGTLIEKAFSLLKIRDASVKGKVYLAQAEWLYVDPTSFCYFHPATEDIARYRCFKTTGRRVEESTVESIEKAVNSSNGEQIQ